MDRKGNYQQGMLTYTHFAYCNVALREVFGSYRDFATIDSYHDTSGITYTMNCEMHISRNVTLFTKDRSYFFSFTNVENYGSYYMGIQRSEDFEISFRVIQVKSYYLWNKVGIYVSPYFACENIQYIKYYVNGEGYLCIECHFLNEEHICKRLRKVNTEIYVKLFRKDNRIVFQYSYDGIEWNKAYEIKDIGLCNIAGTFTETKENNLVDWHTMNHVCIYSVNPENNKNDELKMNYEWCGKTPMEYYIKHEFIDFDCINVDIAKMSNFDLFNLIKIYISNGYFVDLLLDEFYIPKRKVYQECHFEHSNLVVGIDSIAKTVELFGTYENRYIISNVSYQEFIAGFNSTQTSEKYYLNEKVKIFRATDKYVESYSCSDYINAISKYMKYQEDIMYYYGINTYEGAKMLIEEDPYDIRILTFLCEHKKNLNDLLSRLYIRGYISESNYSELSYKSEDIYKRMLMLKSLQMKFIIRYNDKFLSNSFEVLNDLKINENILLTNLIEHLIEFQ
ncbi:MAG: hypothetical protein JXR64_06305 [Spirochaetales bacterium]|nr:hypothetical protein [Spirochaetales bacterium]